MSVDLRDRVAIVTGAGKGLGRAYAEWMAERGAALVVNNRVRDGQPSSARAVADKIVAGGGRAVADEHSIETAAAAQAMAQTALTHFGRIDILVCNAAVSLVETPFVDTSVEQFQAVFDVNLWGTILPLKAAIPAMIANGYGRIVITTSHVGLFGRHGSTAYGTSKLGAVGLARSLALELAPHGIQVNTVAPGAVTQLSSNLGPEFAARAAPERVAPLIGWLCSEACEETGGIFCVMGGKARRVRFVESAIAEIDEDDPGLALPVLNDMRDAIEPRSAPEAGQALVPGPRRFARD